MAEADKGISPISDASAATIDGSGEKIVSIQASVVTETSADLSTAAGGDAISSTDTASTDNRKALPVPKTPPVAPDTSADQPPQFPPAASNPVAQLLSDPSGGITLVSNLTGASDILKAETLEPVPASESVITPDVLNIVNDPIISTTLKDSSSNMNTPPESIQVVGIENVVDTSAVSTLMKDDSPAASLSLANSAIIDAVCTTIATSTPSDITCPAIAAKAGLAAALVNTLPGITLAIKEAIPGFSAPTNPAELSPTVSAIPAISASLAAVPAAAATLVSAPAFPVQTIPVQEDIINNVRDEEIEVLRARVQTLENELVAALSKPGTKNHVLVETIKQQHGELLSKARGMLFDKTKIVKNQELQIEALTAQVASLKDVNAITKDLLEIRNSEIKHLEERMESMESKFKAEKQRHMLVLNRAETGQTINNDLKTEYETQLKIFKELRERYEQRVQALMDENRRLSERVAANASAPNST